MDRSKERIICQRMQCKHCIKFLVLLVNDVTAGEVETVPQKLHWSHTCLPIARSCTIIFQKPCLFSKSRSVVQRLLCCRGPGKTFGCIESNVSTPPIGTGRPRKFRKQPGRQATPYPPLENMGSSRVDTYQEDSRTAASFCTAV